MSRAIPATVCVIAISLLAGCGSISLVPRPASTQRLDPPRVSTLAANHARTPAADP